MAEPFTLYKLIVLYMLDKVDFPLSNTQISDFFLEKEYTNYFTLQQVMHDLIDTNLIRTESTHSNTQYSITPAGTETLVFFHDKISPAIQNDILHYFDENKMELKNENSVLSDFYKTTNNEYAVRCQLKEKGISRIDLTLTVHTKEQAEAICNNWKDQTAEVYAYLMELLLK